MFGAIKNFFDLPVKGWVIIVVSALVFGFASNNNDSQMRMASIVVGAFVLGYYVQAEYVTHPRHCKGECRTIDPKGEGLLPILDPAFNIREICKQMILLEDHLFQPRRHCHDCIRKHFLFMEGFAEEGITLDKDGKYTHILKGLPEKIRHAEKIYWAGEPLDHVAQYIRRLRKSMTKEFFPLKEWGGPGSERGTKDPKPAKKCPK